MSAHIKIKTDKEGAKPYRHCPECGAQYFPRSQAQADKLREKVRSQKIDKLAAETVEQIKQEKIKAIPLVLPIDSEPKYKVVFGVKVPV